MFGQTDSGAEGWMKGSIEPLLRPALHSSSDTRFDLEYVC